MWVRDVSTNPIMNRVATSAAADNDEGHCSNNRNKVERQVHEVSNQLLNAEFAEWFLQCLAQFLNSVSPRVDLSAICNDLCLVFRDQCTVECVQKRVLEQEAFRENRDNGCALVEDKKDSCEHSERPVHEDHDGQLREICEEEHGSND